MTSIKQQLKTESYNEGDPLQVLSNDVENLVSMDTVKEESTSDCDDKPFIYPDDIIEQREQQSNEIVIKKDYYNAFQNKYLIMQFNEVPSLEDEGENIDNIDIKEGLSTLKLGNTDVKLIHEMHQTEINVLSTKNEDMAESRMSSPVLNPCSNSGSSSNYKYSQSERPFKCKICNISFTRLKILSAHHRTHTSERPYVCLICNKSFTRCEHLKAHECTHTKDRPYICSICNLSFIQSGHLSTHQRIHSNDRPHECNICNKSFLRRGHLNRHLLTHPNEDQYRCSICNESFALHRVLSLHMCIHKNEMSHTCNGCNRCFSDSGNLKRHHQLIHSNERSHKCNVCMKSFIRPGDLIRHERIHTNERPYACNKSFTLSGDLRTHANKH